MSYEHRQISTFYKIRNLFGLLNISTGGCKNKGMSSPKARGVISNYLNKSFIVARYDLTFKD